MKFIKFAVLTICLLIPATGAAQDRTIEGVLRSFAEAYNAHDVDKLCQLCSDGIRYVEEGVSEIEGKDKIREKFMWDKAVNSKLRMNIKTIRGNNAIGTAVETSDYYAAAGISEFSYEQIRFTIMQYRILSITVVSSADSNQKLGDSLISFMQWCGSNKPGEIGKLKISGNFAFTAGTAPHWVAMLREWNGRN